MDVYLSIYLTIYLYLSLSISIYLYLSLSISIYLYLSLSISIYLYLSLSIYLSIYLSMDVYLSISIYLSIYLWMSIYLSLSISIYFYLSLSISVYLYLSLSISIYLYLSLSISIYLYLSLSISIYAWSLNEPSRQEMSGTCFRRFGVSKSWPINLLCPHEPCTLPGVSPTAVAPDLSCCSTTVCVALSRSKNVQQPQWHPKTSYQAQPQVFLQRVGAIHFIVNQWGSSFQDEKV